MEETRLQIEEAREIVANCILAAETARTDSEHARTHLQEALDALQKTNLALEKAKHAV